MVKEFSLHRIFLVAICTFALGIMVLPAPKSGGYLAVIVAFLAVAAVYTLIFKLKESKVLSYIVAAVSVVSAAVQIGVITDFFSGNVLNETPKILITALFAVAVIYAALSETEALLKFSLISLPFIVAAVLLILALSFKKTGNFDWRFFIVPKADNFLSQTVKYGMLFIPVLPLPFHSEETYKSLKNDMIGLFIGFAVFSVCFWNTAVFLGTNDTLDFPYYRVAEILSAGGLFTRQTGFIYAVFFIVSFIKASLLIQTVKPVFKSKSTKTQKFVTVAAVILSSALSFLF